MPTRQYQYLGPQTQEAFIGYACRIRMSSKGKVALVAVLERHARKVTKFSSVGPQPTGWLVSAHHDRILPVPVNKKEQIRAYIAEKKRQDPSDTDPFFFNGVREFNKTLDTTLKIPPDVPRGFA